MNVLHVSSIPGFHSPFISMFGSPYLGLSGCGAPGNFGAIATPSFELLGCSPESLSILTAWVCSFEVAEEPEADEAVASVREGFVSDAGVVGDVKSGTTTAAIAAATAPHAAIAAQSTWRRESLAVTTPTRTLRFAARALRTDASNALEEMVRPSLDVLSAAIVTSSSARVTPKEFSAIVVALTAASADCAAALAEVSAARAWSSIRLSIFSLYSSRDFCCCARARDIAPISRARSSKVTNCWWIPPLLSSSRYACAPSIVFSLTNWSAEAGVKLIFCLCTTSLSPNLFESVTTCDFTGTVT